MSRKEGEQQGTETPPAEGAGAQPRSEFKLVLRGISLNAESKARLGRAVRVAVMKEIATLDLKGDLEIAGGRGKLQRAMIVGGGWRTEGIAVRLQ